MRKLIGFLVLVIFTYSGLIAFSGSGSGTSGDPYIVNSASLLNEVRDNLTAHYKQTADIENLSSVYPNWVPIAGGGTGTRFTGQYDGDGHLISGLTINMPSIDNVGLFGHIGYDGDGVSIKNLGLIDVNIQGARGTGSLVGRVTGDINTVIEYCYADGGIVTGDAATGGLVGSNNSYIENASNADNHRPRILYSYANIQVSFSGIGSDNQKFGGLVGCNQKGRIENSYARGSLVIDVPAGKTVDRIGGLAGCTYLRGVIVNSYSAASITLSGEGTTTNVGGLVGYNGGGSQTEYGTVTNCLWDVETSGYGTDGSTDGSAGGIGKSTDKMKTQSTFTDAGWDFITIWEMIGYNYPRLRNNADPALPVILSSFTVSYNDNDANMILQWSTSSESNNSGWNVYRSVSQNYGQSLLINPELIPGAGNSSVPNYYEYLDDTIIDYIMENDIQPNQMFWYWLESVNISGDTQQYGPVSILAGDENEDPSVPPTPDKFGLYANYPNPFNPGTTLSFSLAEDTSGKLVIYNLRGEMIIDVYQGNINAEELYTFTWDGRNSEGNPVASGIYLYKLITPLRTFSRKMILMK